MKKKSQNLNNNKRNFSLLLSIAIVISFLLLVSATLFYLQKHEPRCANSISCINDLSGEKGPENQGFFMGKKVFSPNIPENPQNNSKLTSSVLGDQAGDYKHIYVDLTNQRLYAFEGNNIVMNVPVSTGRWYPTPTGDFRIWIWLKYTRMTGGRGAGYYNLPNVPYTMYFYNSTIPKTLGYALHGAYWHNNFGHPMSHGCVNMRIPDAEKLFYWANPGAGYVSYPTSQNPGTPITIYGITPRE